MARLIARALTNVAALCVAVSGGGGGGTNFFGSATKTYGSTSGQYFGET